MYNETKNCHSSWLCCSTVDPLDSITLTLLSLAVIFDVVIKDIKFSTYTTSRYTVKWALKMFILLCKHYITYNIVITLNANSSPTVTPRYDRLSPSDSPLSFSVLKLSKSQGNDIFLTLFL